MDQWSIYLPPDEIEDEETLEYEYVIVFNRKKPTGFKPFSCIKSNVVSPEEDHSHDSRRHVIISRLNKVGLKVKVMEPDDDKTNDVYALIGAPNELLEEQAEIMGIPMKLKEEFGVGWEPFQRASKHKYVLSSKQNTFRSGQRQHIVKTIIEAEKVDGGADVNLALEISTGAISKVFPFHNQPVREELLSSWASIKNIYKTQPIQKIRNYFGESVAFYFAFLGAYTKSLIVASFVGALSFGLGFLENSGWTGSLFSIFLSLWATAFLNYWKRESSKWACMWHVEEFHNQEMTRPSFQGAEMQGVVRDNVWIPWEKERYGISPKISIWYPPNKLLIKQLIGMMPMILLAMLVLCCTVAILTLRLFLQRSSYSVFGGLIGGIVNAISIIILNMMYKKLAILITDWENHRTQTKYDTMLIIKIFLFQFVNSYTSLFYIAFFKNGVRLWGVHDLKDQCRIGQGREGSLGCADELSVQLASILITNIFVGQTQELLLPWVINKIKIILKTKDKQVTKEPARHEKESQLIGYDGTLDEYGELVIQFGYITLFAAALEIAPLLALLNNAIEIRTDAMKLLKGFNRPHQRGAAGIGIWYPILEFLNVVAVVTNCLLIAFTHHALYEIVGSVFIAFAVSQILEHTIFLLKFTLEMIIPDVPEQVKKVYAIREFVEEQLAKKEKNYLLSRSTNWQDVDEEDPVGHKKVKEVTELE